MTGLCHRLVLPPLPRRGRRRRFPRFLLGLSHQEPTELIHDTRRTPPVLLPVCLSSPSPSILPSYEGKSFSHISLFSSSLSPSASLSSSFTRFSQRRLHANTSLTSIQEHQTFPSCLRRSASSSSPSFSSSLSVLPSSFALLSFPPRSSQSCLQTHGKVRSFTRETGRTSSGGQASLAYRKKGRGEAKGDEELDDLEAENRRRKRANIRSLLLRLKVSHQAR